MPVDAGEITIRDSTDETRHDIDADVLTRIVQGLQKAVRLLAAQEEGIHVARRFKPSKDLREHYKLRLGVPEKGSYSQPLQVIDRRPGTNESLDAV
ncbi:MAG: hypothetical protein PF636_05250, partial [Actinomycetota bacterium]|nr:hypothetical protein [Actinomycetota bacterium]